MNDDGPVVAASPTCEQQAAVESSDEATGAEDFLSVAELEPEERNTLAVEPLPATADQWEELSERIERELEASSADGVHAARLHYQLSIVAEVQRGDRHRALFHLQRALELVPDDLASIRAAQQLFGERQNWGRLLQLLDAELGQTSNLAQRGRLWRQKGQIYEDWLADDEAARAAYLEALAAEPSHALVLQRMHGLLCRVGDHPALIELLRSSIAACDDHRLRALRHAEIGALQLEKLDDAPAALNSYTAAYGEDPANDAVRATLRRLHERRDNWSTVVDLLVAEAEVAVGAQRWRCLGEAAAVSRERLSQGDRALQLLCRVYDENDSRPTVLRELAELLEVAGRFEQLPDVYHRLLAHVEGDEAADLHFRLGSLFELRLGRSDEALEHYQRAVALLPHHAGALSALDRLCRALGRWDALVSLKLQSLPDLADPHDQASLLVQLGQICEVELQDLDRAVKYHERALSVCSRFPAAVRALERLYQRSSSYEQLLGLLEWELQGSDSSSKGAMLQRMALIAEMMLDDRRRAVEYYRRAIELNSANAQLLAGLERLLRDLGEHEELATLLLQQSQHEIDLARRAVWVEQAAQVVESDLGRAEEAIGHYAEVLKIAPTSWAATDALLRLYERLGRWDDLFELVERETTSQTLAPSRLVSARLRLAEIAEAKLAQLDSSSRSATADWLARAERHLQTVLAAQPGHGLALQALERIYRRNEQFERWFELLQAHVGAVPAGLRPPLLFRLGWLCELRLGRPLESTEWYRRALRCDPSSYDYLDALLRRLGAEGRAKEALGVLEQAISGSEDEAARVTLHKRLAAIWREELGDARRAADCLELVVAAGSDDVEVLSHLVQLHREVGDYGRMVDALERLAASTEDVRERIRLIDEAVRAVELYLPERDPAPMYEALLQYQPDDRMILGALLRIYAQRKDYGEMVRVLEVMLPLASCSEEVGGILLRLALCCEQVGDVSAAERALEKAAELTGQWVAAAELQRVRTRAGSGPRLADALRRLAELSRDRGNATVALLDATQIYAEKARGRDQALDALARLLQIDPFHETAARQQEQLLSVTQDWAALAGAIAARVAAARRRQEAVEPANRALCVAALVRLARVQRDRLQQSEGALRSLGEALELDARNLDALSMLAELHGSCDEWHEAAAAYQRAIAVSDDAAFLARIHFRLGRIWQEHLHDPGRAVSAFQNVLVINPQDRRALRRLSRLFLAAGDWENAADTLQRLLDVEGDQSERRRHLLTLADIFEQRFGDPQAAVERLQMALEVDSVDEVVVERLARLNARLGHWRAECEVVRRYLQALPAERVVDGVRQRIRLAGLLERHGQAVEALEEYVQLIQIDPANLDGRLARARLMAELGRSDQAVQAYREVLRIDPINQSALSQLRSLWSNMGSRELSYAAAAVLVCCGLAGESDRNVYRQHRRAGVKVPRAPIDESFFASTVVHQAVPAAGRALLTALSGVAHRLRPANLDRWQVSRVDRLSPRSDDPLRELVGQVSHLLGVRCEVEVYLSPLRVREVALLPTDPPALVVGRGVMANLSSRDVRYWIAELLAYVAGGTWIAYDSDEADLRTLIAAAWEVAAPPRWMAGLEQTPETSEMARQLRRSLSRRSRRALEDAVHVLADDPDRMVFADWVHSIRCTALRTALWVVNDLGVALNYLRVREPTLGDSATPVDLGQALRDHPLGLDLISFWLSEPFCLSKASARG